MLVYRVILVKSHLEVSIPEVRTSSPGVKVEMFPKSLFSFMVL